VLQTVTSEALSLCRRLVHADTVLCQSLKYCRFTCALSYYDKVVWKYTFLMRKLDLSWIIVRSGVRRAAGPKANAGHGEAVTSVAPADKKRNPSLQLQPFAERRADPVTSLLLPAVPRSVSRCMLEACSLRFLFNTRFW